MFKTVDMRHTLRHTKEVSEHVTHISTSWVTPDEAAGYIPGASARSVRDWLAADKIPGAIRLPSGRWQIPWSAVVAILGFDPREHEEPATPSGTGT